MSQSDITARFRLNFPGFSLNVNLNLPGKGTTILFGPSGCGKTTLLRCIAGLEEAAGYLSVNGETWQDEAACLPTHKRSQGYVFQEARLFPHLSVLNNLQYGMKRVKPRHAKASLEQSIELLGIGHLLARKPAGLSGGERQRVAIARALAVRPRLLMMDEPLAALDLPRKQEILPFLERLRDELQIPLIYVTHSPDEVARLADHLVVMQDGKAVASGPLSETLARLDLLVQLGEETGAVLEARVVERDRQWHLARVAFPGGSLWVRDRGIVEGKTIRVRVLARDVSLSLTPQPHSSMLNLLPAIIREMGDGEHPAIRLVRLQVGDSALLSRLTARSAQALKLHPGKRVWAQIKSVAIIR
ncbi:molybdenum ABC transporter ATP-binding protein [Methylohalobius crimeensis]|uniref:molybdenum ABC transporter ATP-binding protein n=1 Tax=Methylohalobius crimeensis TaxID=244365 RepID=UPI0003B42C18|nr:molybdenum ABC transporter ATP-binding protein [Methylohalobius crimeensis]